MNRKLVFPLAVVLVSTLPLLAQRRDEHERGEHGANYPRANQGHIPPPPVRRDNPHARPEYERHPTGRMDERPHVNNDHWYGHDRPDDRRYHFDHPYEHGRFEHVGQSFRYRFERFDPDRHRLWLPGGFYFEVASWDWPVCADWCWDCADDFTIYDDDDHPGWYLLYNVHTGVYVHVNYMGS